MFVNSLIWVKSAQPLDEGETGFDANGNPVSSSPSWSAPIQACTEVLSEDRRAQYEDGRYRAGTYRIHIEIPSITEPFAPTQLKLSRHGEDLGEFAVISCKRLTTVGRIEIVV